MKDNPYQVLLFLICICILSACAKDRSLEIDEGVSLDMAKFRAESISDLGYDLSFSIPSEITEKIPARVAIGFELKNTSKPLIIDFNEDRKNIVSVSSNQQTSKYEFTNGHIVVPASELLLGDNTIVIDFTAGDNSLNRNDEFLYTLFVPDRASTAFPCFDQPNLKARFSLKLEIPEHWVAVANGSLVEKRIDNGRSTYQFAETKPISTYLFSFVAGQFQKITEVRKGREINLYHRETDAEKVARNTKTIFDLHETALKWLEEYTGVSYPFGKFDFVLIPSFQYGGMEHPGAILYRASSLFLEESATQNQKLARASLIAHETAHMWFGNLVTMDWFNDVWMKEVFANFMAAKIVNPSFPEMNHALRFLLRHYPSAYEVDRTSGANPIRQELDNLKEAGTLYGAIIYQKAPIVMRHLERLIGEAAFQEGIRGYLTAFSYGNATWPDLIEILDRKSSEDLRAWSRVWVDEPGRPHIKVEIAPEHGNTIASVKLRQIDPLNKGRLWNQQMEVVLAKEKNLWRFPAQLRDKGITIDEAKGLPRPDFILANGGGYGYGNFLLDASSREYLLASIYLLEDELVRGVAWITLWEEMLDTRLQPSEFFRAALLSLEHENEPQIIQRILDYVETAFWKFQSEEERREIAGPLEKLLWQLVQNPRDKGVQLSYFRTYRDIATTPKALANLEKILYDKLTIKDLSIQENDMTALAFELALRMPAKANEFASTQLARIKNSDRKARFEFIMPAISVNESKRDNFFESLKDEKNRTHEPWALTALGYLHHPLRASSSIKYLRSGLELVEEIQRTGDIFFPKRWLDATFRGHNSPQAAEIVAEFLQQRPDYPARLKGKILQSTDLLFRAARIVHDWQTSAETDS